MATILFMSEFCLLDRESSTARGAAAMMAALAAAGHSCHALTMGLFTGHTGEVTARDMAGPIGRPLSLFRAGVSHIILRTFSRRLEALRPWDDEAFARLALDGVRRLKPDLVLTYSGSRLWPALRLAQMQGARTAFYVASESWADERDVDFRHIDTFIASTQAMADYFCEKKAIAPERMRVVRDILDPLPPGPSPLDHIASRHKRRVTMVHPQPGKGGNFFLHLAAQAQLIAPDLRFMTVERSWGKVQWQAMGAPVAGLSNLCWQPPTDDMSAIFKQSALLLVPTLSFEGSGRIIAEAMQAGVPVLAMDRGAIAEQMDGGGFLFQCPPALMADQLRAPDRRTLDHWLHFIATLMRDDGLYTRAVKLALAAAERATPDVRRRAALTVFDELLARPPILASDMGDVVQAALLAGRARMQGVLDQVGQAERPELRAANDRPSHLEQHPYAEALRLSLAQPAMRAAVTLMKDGEREAARDALEVYLRAMPNDYWAVLLMADLVAGVERNLSLALALARQAADLAPFAAEPRLAIRRYLAGLREDDDAVDPPVRDDESVTQLRRLGGDGAGRTSSAHGQGAVDPLLLSCFVDRMKGLFTADLLDAHIADHTRSATPVFVLGADAEMIAEVAQFLEEEGHVAALGEAPFLPKIASFFNELRPDPDTLPHQFRFLIGTLPASEYAMLAHAYLERVEARLGSLPGLFVDTQPENWAFIGLARLLFPSGRFVYAVRSGEGTALCSSAGSSQAMLAEYQIALIDHFEAIEPGCVHRVDVDALVANGDGEAARLLAYCGLPPRRSAGVDGRTIKLAAAGHGGRP